MATTASQVTPLADTSVPMARYRFIAQVHDTLHLPPYAGSLLRGQFGAALRHLVCTTRQPGCEGCPLRSTCQYTRIFEAPAPEVHALQRFSAIPNAYVIEPPLPEGGLTQGHSSGILTSGQRLGFNMVLIGQALTQLPLIIVAWQRALAQGLTKSRSQLELTDVSHIETPGLETAVWSCQRPKVPPHTTDLQASLPTAKDILTLQFHTPLRLQHQGRPLRAQQLSPRTLISAIARRIALILEFHASQPQWGQQVPGVIALAEQLDDQRQLHWFDWTRYSSRQRQEMTLGGVLGQWQLKGPAEVLAALWPWLWLGQWTHVGKNASFGLGGYRLTAT